MLPIQLIPYFQYTVSAVIGTLLLGLGFWQLGHGGFFDASIEVDQDSLLTPYLIFCWLKVVVRGFRRAHAVLRRFYDLSGVHTSKRTVAWEEMRGYFLAFGLKPHSLWWPLLSALLRRYCMATTQFLFGTASQHRVSNSH